MAKRGQLTEAIKLKAMELLGVEITQREIRLMPYVQYCAVNDGFIDHIRTNSAEREILSRWELLGFGGFTGSIHDTEDGPLCVWLRPIEVTA